MTQHWAHTFKNQLTVW